MCFALFIAAASIFLARQNFPLYLQKTGVLVFLGILPLLLLIFWLVRVRIQQTLTRRKRKVIGRVRRLMQSLAEKPYKHI